jgi:aurora kinase
MSDFFYETIKQVEYSEDVLSLLSPQVTQTRKKRRSMLGDAVRIKTPVKARPSTCLSIINSSNKENSTSDTVNQQSAFHHEPNSIQKVKVTNRNSFSTLKTPTKISLDTASFIGYEETENQNHQTSTSLVPADLQQIQQDSFRQNLNRHRNWKVSDFTLGKPLGKGKFGNVYYAKQKETGSAIALKVLFKSTINGNELYFKMLKREIEIQYRLKHENINCLYSYFHDTKHIYLILEYANNGEFYKYLSTNRAHISEEKCKHFIIQIAKALKYMHERHIIHRDLKPENILMKNNYETVMLADYGSAVHAPPPLHSTRYTVCGTPEYLSPEMVLGSGHDTSLDMWSLGILMYEILFGR